MYISALHWANVSFSRFSKCFSAWPICQAAEKEANLARQEEERVEQRRKAKSDKKAQKKFQRGNRVGEKRKAEQDDYHDEWNEDYGKYSEFYNTGRKITVDKRCLTQHFSPL